MPPQRREEPKKLSRRGLLVALAGTVFAAAALVAASIVGARGDSDASPAAVATASTARDPLLRGIPQDGITLGRPDAQVTVVEYADLQCPYCAEWAREAFPAVVRDYVRTGRVRMVFRGLAFIGPDSDTALRAVLAAGAQDRLWDVVHALFARQGRENTGWVTSGLLRSLGHGGLDAERMLDQSHSAAVERELDAAARAAEAARVPGTPYFEAGPTGGPLAPLRLDALDARTFAAELDRLLAA
jgi:protein-disulfide isomerase